ncbi:coiled-coil domain-containing protein 42 like-2 [Syngnathoides biaculeatus]|uniref:coiled-coil domain-containing protein 42 like-2 n=1 Tax=Syngnathoides biaculeatus TaxID=300417 RepID=UPI002ADE2833|nr:coiled-coil domain-containing protein 42 like-2 [Syngnathoides biaculeatus]
MSDGEGSVVGAMWYRDRTDTLVEIFKDRREQERLAAELEQRVQKLESLRRWEDELLREAKKVEELLSNVNRSPKEQDPNVEKAEEERKEAGEKELEKKTLEEEHAQLQHRKRELVRRISEDATYCDFMRQVLKITQFEDDASLAGHLESLLGIRERLCEKQRSAEEQVDRRRKELLSFRGRRRAVLLQRGDRLSRLHRSLDAARLEVERWEQKWKHIQDEAAQETLPLGLIKMATLNLYELTGGDAGGEGGVPLSDTRAQLDKIKMFMEDHKDIARQLPSRSDRNPKPC